MVKNRYMVVLLMGLAHLCCSGLINQSLAAPSSPGESFQGCTEDGGWCCSFKYCAAYSSADRPKTAPAPLSGELEPDSIRSVMARVATWQLAHPGQHHPRDWTQGALYAGLTAWGLMADDPVYLDSLRATGERNHWQLGDRKYHADDHRVGWAWLQLYKKFGDERMLQPTKSRLDWLLANPSHASLQFDSPNCLDRWCWCDALFMSPPVLAQLAALTNDRKYLDFMDQELWSTTDYLYDQQEHLYYRDSRYFTLREANGAKVFWSRGNGWVLAGLAQVLDLMPRDYPKYENYVRLYKEMAAKIASIQPADGLWRPSLLDPESYAQPETSGSGFYCYALAWGINKGLLDRDTYLPVVKKAWAGLVNAVHPDGKLGYVQPIGADPRHVTADMTEVYGVGAFLLAGSEVYKISILPNEDALRVEVTNPTGLFREQETVELVEINKKFPVLRLQDIAIYAEQENAFLLTQAITGIEGIADQLLFQSRWAPYETKTFWLLPANEIKSLPNAVNHTHAMYVPQRKDDFAWESDRIAFRMYGPALEEETISSGVDVWVKSVHDPILEKWYKSDDYHVDHGEGLDFYKVGPSRGCGGLAIWKNDILYGSRNYRTSKILANGPIRSIFELRYEPWNAEATMVSEVKRISIDLGHNLSRFESTFTTDETELELAVGIVRVGRGGEMTYNLEQGWLSYWQPPDPVNGIIGCGVVIPGSEKVSYFDYDNHGLLVKRASVDKSFCYYAGAGWNKSGQFPDRAAWIQYIQDFAQRAAHPLQIRYVNSR